MLKDKKKQYKWIKKITVKKFIFFPRQPTLIRLITKA